MGRTLDVLLGRTTKQTARLKSLLGLATKRITVVRAHRQVRLAQARGDVEQLLRLGHPDRALARADQVLREQDMLDVLDTLDSYCTLLADRAALVDAQRECPDELREAAAGLVYAAARLGDLPELQEVRALLAAKFGRGFVAAAAELRSGCGIDTKVVQKLSTKQPSLESRQMVLVEIGAEKEIPVRLHDPSYHQEPVISNHHSHKSNDQHDEMPRATPRADNDDDISAHAPLAFKDVEAAAQAAFESAATAAAAAKAAIELSRAGSGDPDEHRYRRTHGHGDDEVPHRREDLPRSRPASVRTNRGGL
ncbi:IST1-like protein [Lolium rigidum]|uniref:IST1-like protein n=1 Tax=Lolium rigidum TaxID=89674 RepID=UPI001F5C3F9D|nr:IST1-like protein [Lolium rigidum]